MRDRDGLTVETAERLAERAADLARDLGACARSDSPPALLPVARRIADALAQAMRLIVAHYQPRVDARALREEADRGLLPPDAEARWGDPAGRAAREGEMAAEAAAAPATPGRKFVDSGEICAHCGKTRGAGRWASKLRMHWHCARSRERAR